MPCHPEQLRVPVCCRVISTWDGTPRGGINGISLVDRQDRELPVEVPASLYASHREPG